MHKEHLWRAIEGHEHPWWFHFQVQRELFGWASYLLLPLGAFFFLSKGTSWKTSLFLTAVIVFLIFSMAGTKMISFTYAIAALLALMIGWSVSTLLTSGGMVMGKMAMRSMVILFALVMVLDNGRPWETWSKTQNEGRPQRILRQKYSDALREFQREHDTKKAVFVGVPHIMVPLTIWLTDGTAYLPTFPESEYERIMEDGYQVWTFEEEAGSLRIVPVPRGGE